MTRLIAVENDKGGCGKTTTAVTVAAGLARRGHRVLLTDCDPHTSASHYLRLNLDKDAYTLYDAILDNVDIGDTIQPTGFKNLYIITGDDQLKNLLNKDLLDEFGSTFSLHPAIMQFDYVVFDTQPSATPLRSAMMLAASEVIIPVMAEASVLKGFVSQLKGLDTWAKRRKSILNNPFEEVSSFITGVVVTSYVERFATHRKALPELQKALALNGIQILGTLPHSGAISSAVEEGTPIPWAGKHKNLAIFEACEKLVRAVELVKPQKIFTGETEKNFEGDMTYE